ncbi:MAG: flagellar biosynthetic protein FliO [Simkaniaceae bacterium]|nr:flagellar biosynthetic protein FliO [Simkaniaceae bacterium]
MKKILFLIFLSLSSLIIANETPEPMKSTIQETTLSYESAFMKTMLILALIVVLMGLTFWMFKRLSQSRVKQQNYMKSIKILEKRPISPKSILYLIEVAGKQILIAESQIEVRTIQNFDWPKKENFNENSINHN